jgi:hypothetical protein
MLETAKRGGGTRRKGVLIAIVSSSDRARLINSHETGGRRATGQEFTGLGDRRVSRRASRSPMRNGEKPLTSGKAVRQSAEGLPEAFFETSRGRARGKSRSKYQNSILLDASPSADHLAVSFAERKQLVKRSFWIPTRDQVVRRVGVNGTPIMREQAGGIVREDYAASGFAARWKLDLSVEPRNAPGTRLASFSFTFLPLPARINSPIRAT